ncbi:hypothetical protein, partial [Tepidimonas sp.]|uniref:hypothetical protein n=1 Tax=Tepidimonas sp. TaxID=2002775 RepID=UPI0039A3E9E9
PGTGMKTYRNECLNPLEIGEVGLTPHQANRNQRNRLNPLEIGEVGLTDDQSITKTKASVLIPSKSGKSV